MLNLANNHILDHGPQGLESTLQAAEAAGIATFGAGRDREEAAAILVRTVGGIRIGILGVAEHEFSIATADVARRESAGFDRYRQKRSRPIAKNGTI